MKTSAISTLQIEMGEMQSQLRGDQTVVTYWVNLHRQRINLPARRALEPTSE